MPWRCLRLILTSLTCGNAQARMLSECVMACMPADGAISWGLMRRSLAVLEVQAAAGAKTSLLRPGSRFDLRPVGSRSVEDGADLHGHE